MKEFLNPLLKRKSLGEEIPDFDTTFRELENHDLSKIQVVEVKFLEAQHLSVYNCSLPDLINKFIEIGFDRFIILERKNYLKRMISHCVGQQTNLYHLKNGNKPQLHSIKMDIGNIKIGKGTNTLIDWFRIIKKDYGNLRSYLINTEFIEFKFEEDIQTDVRIAYDKVCSFLNIENHEVEIPFVRTNPFDIKDILINFEEVDNKLTDIEFSWMLRE